MPHIQKLRLFNALKKLKNFKNDKVMNQLRVSMYGTQIGSNSQNSSQDPTDSDPSKFKFKSYEPGYFTGEESDLESGFSGQDPGDFSVDEDEFDRFQEKMRDSKHN